MEYKKIKNKIKVVYWDLDDTLWKGTLSEDDSVELISNRINIIRELNKRGIVNSIISKNDFSKAKEKLCELGIWECFVFPKIAFTAKGEMIKQALADMNLREDNACFIDDNEFNLREAEFYNPKISIIRADLCDDILNLSEFEGKDDKELSRLKQYRQLERKADARQLASSNETFLKSSNIRVELIPYKIGYLDRIAELCERTNQLNFTKNRMNKEQLAELFNEPNQQTRIVRVVDNFGDYGIIGFYTLRNGRLIHYVFSCRIMSMGIEQWVYAKLNFPEIEIVGETASELREGECPQYITEIELNEKDFERDDLSQIIDKNTQLKIFAIGACDLYHPIAYFDMPNQSFLYECNVFNGKERGVNVGTEYIRSSIEMNENEKEYVKKHFLNYQGSLAFNSKIFADKYDYVIMSFHDDMIFKIYNHKENSNLRVLLSPEPIRGITSSVDDEGNVISGEAQFKWLEKFFNEGVYITPKRFKENILWIKEHLDEKTKIVLITGPELDYFRKNKLHYPEIRERIMLLNKVLFELEKEYPKIFAVADINNVIKSLDHVTDYVFHLTAQTAYRLFVETVWQIVRKLGSNKLPLLYKVRNNRKLVIFGNGLQAQKVFYNLRLGNEAPCEYVHFDYKDRVIGTMKIQDCSILEGKSDVFYVAIADDAHENEIEEYLNKIGYVHIKDYINFHHTKVYKSVWNENLKEFNGE